MMKNQMVVAAAAMFVAGAAMGGTVDLRYVEVAGGSGATHLRVGGTTYFAGHMVHEYTSGARSGDRFSTFCIDVGEYASTSGATYDIVNVADAPAPGAPYGQAVADQISAVVANAVALGWIDNKLQADTGQSDYLAKMGAIQAAIWEAIGADVQVGSGSTTSSLQSYYAVLMNGATFDDSLRLAGLRAIVAPGQQDMLYVVPLPPAAFAGAGLLAVGLGVRAYKRRAR